MFVCSSRGSMQLDENTDTIQDMFGFALHEHKDKEVG